MSFYIKSYMEDRISKFYEDLYTNPAESKKHVFGKPEKELVRFLNSVKWEKNKIKILDLGCGDGRNTIYLAKKFDVTGIDNSSLALRKLKKFIANTRIAKNIHLIKTDLKTIKLKPNIFDFVLCVNTFHEIGINGIRNVIKQVKFATKPSGINYLAFGIFRKGAYMREECYWPKSELGILKQYNNWKIIKKKKTLIIHSHPTPYSKGKRVRHKHYICHLFLQKLVY